MTYFLVTYLEDIDLAKEKPFPLVYEEIYLTKLREKRVSESEVKAVIAEKVKLINSNEVHESIRELHLSHILTTNYDYTIEKALAKNSIDLSDQGVVKQERYSLFRHTEVNGIKIWHIHGELNKPGTMLLGFEHYIGQLQLIRNYVVSGKGNPYRKRFRPLKDLLKTGRVRNYSWVDLFFTADIHIVGLSLDFVETDLWWLITYRARRKLEGKSPIENNITYYYPKEMERAIRSKLEVFRANEVKTEAFGNKHDLNYYRKVFNHIKSKAS